MNIEKVRKAIKEGRIEWRLHALEKLLERGISLIEVKDAILSGEIIEDYTESKPFPSCLILGFVGTKAIHAVFGWDSVNKKVHIITGYRPSLNKFEPDYKTRRKS